MLYFPLSIVPSEAHRNTPFLPCLGAEPDYDSASLETSVSSSM